MRGQLITHRMLLTRGLLATLLGALLLVLAGCAPAGAGTGAEAEAGASASPRHLEGVELDSSAIDGWASEVVSFNQGSEASGYADTTEAIGPASGIATEVLVLGRGGIVTVTFSGPLADSEGAELAVFENGLGSEDELFAELAYVEVSSNGTDFARFPNKSEITGPVGSYERVNTAAYSGLAGLHPKGSGTAFDFAELAGEPEVAAGNVDLGAIRYVRLIDVVGDGSASDSDGNTLYDPYPTTGTAGFDLDGVAYFQGGR